VLYHVPEPMEALIWMREQSKTLFLGTHYIEPEDRPAFDVYTHKGKNYHGIWWKEDLVNPVDGMSSSSFCPYEADLIEMLKGAGYSQISILGRDLQNHFPHITILAE
jgi:hypothetical protein